MGGKDPSADRIGLPRRSIVAGLIGTLITPTLAEAQTLDRRSFIESRGFRVAENAGVPAERDPVLGRTDVGNLFRARDPFLGDPRSQQRARDVSDWRKVDLETRIEEGLGGVLRGGARRVGLRIPRHWEVAVRDGSMFTDDSITFELVIPKRSRDKKRF